MVTGELICVFVYAYAKKPVVSRLMNGISYILVPKILKILQFRGMVLRMIALCKHVLAICSHFTKSYLKMRLKMKK